MTTWKIKISTLKKTPGDIIILHICTVNDNHMMHGSWVQKTVYWRKNLFMVPTGTAGKKFINEATKMLNFWTVNSPLKLIALKALHIMPALLLQKPSKTLKSKDHLAALSRRLELWDNGKISELLYNGNDEMNTAKISSKFKDLMQKGNVNGVLKLLTNNMSNRILPLIDETF